METPITLGMLVAKLGQSPQDNYLLFDFGGFAPESLRSYRGTSGQEQLAIGFAPNLELKVGDFLPMLKAAIGKACINHKGTNCSAHNDTPVQVSNYGPMDNWVIADVLDVGKFTVLLTGFNAHDDQHHTCP